MKKWIVLLILAILVAFIAVKMHIDTGYVLISYAHWKVETNIWIAALCLLFFILIIYLLTQLIRFLLHWPSALRRWKEKKYQRKAREISRRGWLELVKEHWKEADHLFLKSAEGSQDPAILYLAAAYCASKRGVDTQRDLYLENARKHLRNTAKDLPEALTGVNLFQAWLQMQNQEWHKAEDTLVLLPASHDMQPVILKGLSQLYIELKDWTSLQLLLPRLRKYHVLSATELEQMEGIVWQGILENLIAQKEPPDSVAVTQIWKQVPTTIQPLLTPFYVKYLLSCHRDNEAIILIEYTLKWHWDEKLIQYYGLAEGSQLDKQIRQAENWLKKHPDNALLLCCLGQLCMRAQMWGKGQYYLEQSLRVSPKPSAYLISAQIQEALGNKEAALLQYREGLIKAIGAQ